MDIITPGFAIAAIVSVLGLGWLAVDIWLSQRKDCRKWGPPK